MAIRSIIESRGDIVSEVVTDPHDAERVIVATHQDVAPVVALARMRAELPMDSEMRPVAEIPMVVVERMMQDGSWNDPAAIRRWLNSPENAAFRIWRGRV